MLVSMGGGVKKIVSGVFFFSCFSYGLGVKPSSPSRFSTMQNKIGMERQVFFNAKLTQKANCRPERAMNPVSG